MVMTATKDMVEQAQIETEEETAANADSSATVNEDRGCNKAGSWPQSIIEAYARPRGPFTIKNIWPFLSEESIELYNGWLVWQEMTEPEERRIAGAIQEILSLAARAAGFGQAYPDQLECLMTTGDVVKPDICLLSMQRFQSQVIRVSRKHTVLKGGPELVVEIRSPSNSRPEESKKRKKYFDSGTLVVWDVDPETHKLWVWEAQSPDQSREYSEADTVDCPSLLPGWTRKVADFFAFNLSAEEIVGEEAQLWRNESRAEGRIEGQLLALRQVLLLQASSRFPTAAVSDLETRLAAYNQAQLTALAQSILASATLEEWLANFPA